MTRARDGLAPARDGLALVRDGLARALYEAGTILGASPRIALAVARRRGHGFPVDARSELLVEGYPRSANSFAVAALARLRPGIRIAHHLHAPGHVIAAVRLGVPALVLIREPEDAVVELALLKPALTPAQMLRGYVRFYEPLERYLERIVVARTSEVTGDFGVVVGRLNERFGLGLPAFEHSEEAAAAVHRAIQDVRAGAVGPGLPLIGRGTASEIGREAERARLRRAYAGLHPGLRVRAERLHETFTRGTTAPPGGRGTRL
ncbi:MAG TPA: hypothetical protein VFC04_01275 [Actinomycetota bacterium]|jgi:hypothetical protein|nr:hypothetical protein [Actinomycetota bacterium]